MQQQLISGWGRVLRQRCDFAQPKSLDALRELVSGSNAKSCIARGLGRSYGDAALNDLGIVISQTRLNRLIAFDTTSGLLECGAGVSLAEIIDHFLPRGWFLPITPGTKFVTVGGAIAADVHGKNHHVDGTFGQHVESLRLLCASGRLLNCSPDRHADAFWATIGGMGLTGIIVDAKIRLQPVSSAYYDVVFKRTANLDETLDQFQRNDKSFRYSVAWVDCLARGGSLGRSVLLMGRDAVAEDLPEKLRGRPLMIPRRRGKSVPFNLPGWVLNPWTVKAFNALYYAKHHDQQLLLDFESYLYPLDHVANWNRIYGKRGFVQYQALFPKETSRQGLVALLERISSLRAASFLAVLKSSGPANPGLLSYLFDGHTLALDLPNTGHGIRELCRELDEILMRYGGRLYLAKDSMMIAEAFSHMYPRLAEFREVKARLDPEMKFDSSQARRVGITSP